MNGKMNFTLALAAGLLGGLIATYARPALLHAQTNAPKVVQAQNFVLVNERGHKLGEITIEQDEKPNIRLFEETPVNDVAGGFMRSVLWSARGALIKQLGSR